MASISASGVGSGIDILSLVSQLVEAEKLGPESLLDARESELNSQISAVGTLKSDIATFQDSLAKLTDPDDFVIYANNSSNENTASFTSNSFAKAGSFDITVIKLAAAHKLSTAGFADSDTTEVGTGNLTLANADGDSFALSFAGGGDNTLNQVRDAINNAADNFGVTATIINIDDGVGGTLSKLQITANDTGTSNALTLTADPSLSALDSANLTQIKAADDAVIQIDDPSNQFTSASNTISGAISGIEITAKAVGTTTISTTPDQTGIVENVQGFVDAYNKLQSTFNTVSSYNDGNPGPLFSDSTIRSIKSQITSIVSNSVASSTSSYNSLSAIGITTNNVGLLELDQDDLKTALNANFASVSTVFTATDGITARLDTVLEEYTKFAGLLDTKRDSLNTRLSLIGESRDKLEYRIGKLEARLTAQFIAMDGLVASLNSTGSFLTQQLASLPGFTRSSS
ncbi:flagellar filament capping protein FliD [Dasania marina]|uniref:flagellar filament capping protein FliD n=1 Tax=Dasania marina TaxID=471499 RepID=UPI0030D977E1|tara:strand:+ start:49306 stop:50682 length:1377 start_codon:yes stop_codon:yes gene_type:complete